MAIERMILNIWPAETNASGDVCLGCFTPHNLKGTAFLTLLYSPVTLYSMHIIFTYSNETLFDF